MGNNVEPQVMPTEDSLVSKLSNKDICEWKYQERDSLVIEDELQKLSIRIQKMKEEPEKKRQEYEEIEFLNFQNGQLVKSKNVERLQIQSNPRSDIQEEKYMDNEKTKQQMSGESGEDSQSDIHKSVIKVRKQNPQTFSQHGISVVSAIISDHQKSLNELEKLVKDLRTKRKEKKREIVAVIQEEFMKEKIEFSNKIYHNFSHIFDEKFPNLLRLCEEILRPSTTEEISESDDLQDDMNDEIKNKKLTEARVAIILMGLKEMFERGRIRVRFSKKSSAKTQLCMKIITSGFMEDITKFTEIAEQESFYQLRTKQYALKEFLLMFTKRKAEEYKMKPEDIYISKIFEEKKKVAVEWAVLHPKIVTKLILMGELRYSPFFQELTFSKEDFNQQGNFNYNSSPFQDDRRGGWPYYPPAHCLRCGINIKQKYDDKNQDIWMNMNGHDGEWAVAFHPLSIPGTSCRDKSVLNAIQHSKNKDILVATKKQTFEKQKAVNKNEEIGQGLYCSPYFLNCIDYCDTEVHDRKYHMIVQSRVDPQKIKVCPNSQDFWVLNDSKSIRPYGIILLKSEDIGKIKPPKQLFKWEKHQYPSMN